MRLQLSKMFDVTFRAKSTISCSAAGFSEELFLAEVLPLTFAYLGISTWWWTDWHLVQALVTYYVWAKITCPFSMPMHKLPRVCRFLLHLDNDILWKLCYMLSHLLSGFFLILLTKKKSVLIGSGEEWSYKVQVYGYTDRFLTSTI